MRAHIERVTSTLQDTAIILNDGLPKRARFGSKSSRRVGRSGRWTANKKNCRIAVSCPSMIPNEHGACALDSRPLSKGSEKSISDLAGYISNGGTGYIHSPDFECCLSIKTISHNQNVANVLNANEHQRKDSH